MPTPVRLKLSAAFLAGFVTAGGFAACGGMRGGSPGSLSPVTYMNTRSDSSGPVCEHLEDPWSIRICPDYGSTTYFKPVDVTAETLEVHTAGRILRIGIAPRSDAIFLTPSALSTFLLRHYDATNPGEAAQLREFMRNNYRRRP